MSTDSMPMSKEELFRRKALRRRDLAALPIEEKLKRVVKLQYMAAAIGKQAGRAYRIPWGHKTRKCQP